MLFFLLPCRKMPIKDFKTVLCVIHIPKCYFSTSKSRYSQQDVDILLESSILSYHFAVSLKKNGYAGCAFSSFAFPTIIFKRTIR